MPEKSALKLKSSNGSRDGKETEWNDRSKEASQEGACLLLSVFWVSHAWEHCNSYVELYIVQAKRLRLGIFPILHADLFLPYGLFFSPTAGIRTVDISYIECCRCLKAKMDLRTLSNKVKTFLVLLESDMWQWSCGEQAWMAGFSPSCTVAWVLLYY